MDDITEGIRRIRRIGTQAERIAANPILELGEIAGEIDTGVLYVGDGVTHVNDLPGTATGTSASAVLIKGSDTYANITAIVSPTDGDLWIQTDDAGGGLAGDGLLWDGSAWVNIGQIRGPAGAQGDPGPTGLSAYEEAVVGGFIGTESEWLESLVGADGAPGAGVPIGGDVGSIPTKASETDYDLTWSTPDEVVDPIVGEHAASGHIGLADADFGGFGAKNVKQVVSTSLTIPYAAAVAIDVAGGPAAQSIILTGDTTVTVSGGEVDTYSAVVFEVVQDETGGHAVTWAGVSEWHNGVSTIDPTADSHSFITFLAFGSRVVGVTGFDLSPYLLAEANGATLTDLGGVTNRVSTVLSSGAARTLNMGLFTTFDVTMSADCTFTFDSVPASGEVRRRIILRGAFTPTFPAEVTWLGGTQPTHDSISIFEVVTVNGGAEWFGSSLGVGASGGSIPPPAAASLILHDSGQYASVTSVSFDRYGTGGVGGGASSGAKMIYILAKQGNANTSNVAALSSDGPPSTIDGYWGEGDTDQNADSMWPDNHGTASNNDTEIAVLYKDGQTDTGDITVNFGATCSGVWMVLELVGADFDLVNYDDDLNWAPRTAATVPELTGLTAGDLGIAVIGYGRQTAGVTSTPPTEVEGEWTLLASKNADAGTWRRGVDVYVATAAGATIASEAFVIAADTQCNVLTFVGSAA